MRAATGSLGIPEANLTVHDFEVRTFPAVRQEILEILVAVNSDLQPDLVLMPSLGDIHQDHETIAREGTAGVQAHDAAGLRDPLELLSASSSRRTCRCEARHLDAKVAALECYRSQQHRNYANEEYIRNIARTHGIESGRELAEVFEVYRWVM